MRQTLANGLGTLMIAGGLLGASVTMGPLDQGVAAHEGTPTAETTSEAHGRMHEMMDQMMGDGASERMHAAMPGSEAMMEACAAGMSRMGGMMHGTDTMPMHDMHESDGTPSTEEDR